MKRIALIFLLAVSTTIYAQDEAKSNFDYISNYGDKNHSSWAMVRVNDNYGFIDREGKIVVPRPFNAMNRTTIEVHLKDEIQEIPINECDQYAIQADAFANCILNGGPIPTPLNDAIENMKVIEALKESAETRRKVKL